MLEQFVYVDHLGRRFDGREQGVYLNESDLRDYDWCGETVNQRITRFSRGVTERSLPLILAGRSADESARIRHRLLDYAESDIEAGLSGRVYIGDYYMNGFITASKKSRYLTHPAFAALTLKLTSEDGFWYRDQLYSFAAIGRSYAAPTLARAGTDARCALCGQAIVGLAVAGFASSALAESGADYPGDYDREYAYLLYDREIVCQGHRPSAFRLLIYGPCLAPAVVIGGNRYAVNGAVEAGEILEIDSQARTVTLIDAHGNRTNRFNERSRTDYIFRPIQPGRNAVSWNGSFGFDLTVIERRSEPKWT